MDMKEKQINSLPILLMERDCNNGNEKERDIFCMCEFYTALLFSVGKGV